MSDQASGTKKDQHEKLLHAMIEAAAVTNPTLKERVSIAAAWQFMQLPDDSFGWAGKKDQNGNRPPMPTTCKVLCILEALAVGLRPGTGQVIWLGNKPFISADAKRYLANSSRELSYFGEVEYLTPTADERAMFGLVDGDMAIWVKRQVKFKGEQAVWKGLGIIAKAELDYRDNYGKPRAGMQSKKDAVQTLFTRAENMMLKYNYPVGGLADLPDDPAGYIDVYSQDADAAVAANVMQIEAAPAGPSLHERELAAALIDFNRAVANCEAAGLSAIDVLLSDLDYYLNADDVDLIAEATDELRKAFEHQMDAHKRKATAEPIWPAPTPIPPIPVTSMSGAVGSAVQPREPPPAAAAPRPAPAAKPAPAVAAPGEEKRGRGRPPKKKEPVVVERVETYTQTEVISTGAGGAMDLPEGYEIADPAVFDQADEERAELAEQEFEEMDRPTVLPEVELSEIPKSALQAARDADIEQQQIRLEKAIKSVKLRGGHLQNICGGNPLNALESGDPARMEATSQLLEAWSPPAAPAAAKTAAKPAPAPAAPPPPAPAPASVADSESVRMIDRALAQGPLDPTYVKLVNQLRALPHPKELYMQLPQALRVGKKGDYSYLQALIRSCSK